LRTRVGGGAGAGQPANRARVETSPAHGQNTASFAPSANADPPDCRYRAMEAPLPRRAGRRAPFPCLERAPPRGQVDVGEIEVTASWLRRPAEYRTEGAPRGCRRERSVAVDQLTARRSPLPSGPRADVGAPRGAGARDGRRAEREAEARTHRRRRRARVPPAGSSAPSRPSPKDACVDVVERQSAAVEVGRERAEIRGVGPLRRRSEPSVLEEAVDRGSRV
jgi:hypothetical protein